MRTHPHRWRKVRFRMATVLVIECLTILSIAAVYTIPARADIALMAYMNEGAAVHNGTHICMPDAYVNINITRTGSTMRTNMIAEFRISTNMTQNATLGFIPPKIGTSYNFGTSYNSDLSISVNEFQVTYALLGWEDLGVDHGFATELIDALGTWVEDAEYAVFNMELLANSTIIITVISSTSQGLNVNSIAYEYTIASARTFEGDTHEVVHIRLVEETPFLSVGFSPSSHLTITEEGIQTDAVWDFYVSEMTDSSVGMYATVQEYHGYKPIINLESIIFASGIIAIIVVLLILHRRKLIP